MMKKSSVNKATTRKVSKSPQVHRKNKMNSLPPNFMSQQQNITDDGANTSAPFLNPVSAPYIPDMSLPRKGSNQTKDAASSRMNPATLSAAMDAVAVSPRMNQAVLNSIKNVRFTADNDNGNLVPSKIKKRPNTNADILDQSLRQIQDSFLTSKAVADRRANYFTKDYVPLDVIPTWTELAPKLNIPLNADILGDNSEEEEDEEKDSGNLKKGKKPANLKMKKGKKVTKKKSSVAPSLPLGLKATFNPTINDKISIHRGDLAKMEVDAVVCSTSSKLEKTEMSGTTFSGAGLNLNKEILAMRQSNRVPTSVGDVVATCGYQLPAYYVLFANSLFMDNEDLLAKCYHEVLELAVKMKIRSIAFPCLATGGYGFPSARAAPVAIRTVRTWLEKDLNLTRIDRIVFCIYKDADWKSYEKSMPVYFPVKQPPTNVTLESLGVINGTQTLHLENLRLVGNVLQHGCGSMSFRGSVLVNDLFFWTLHHLSFSAPHLSLLDCTGAHHLTDSALLTFPTLFPALQKLYLDGCYKVGDSSVTRVLIKCEKLNHLSVYGTNVQLLPSVSPEIVLHCSSDVIPKPTKKQDTSRVYKVIVVRSSSMQTRTPSLGAQICEKGNSEPWEGIMKSFVANPAFGKLNIIECDVSLLPLVGGPGSIVILPPIQVDGPFYYKMLSSALIHCPGSPIVITSQKGGELVKTWNGKLKEAVQYSIKQLSYLDWAAQISVGHLCAMHYWTQQEDLIMETKFESVTSFSSPFWKKVTEKVSQDFPQFNHISGFMPSADASTPTIKMNLSATHALHSVGEVVRLDKDNNVIAVSVLDQILSELSKHKNQDPNDLKLAPFLDKDTAVFHLFHIYNHLSDAGYTDNVEELFAALCGRSELVWRVGAPWTNDISPKGIGMFPSLLPSVPMVELGKVWEQQWADDEDELAMVYDMVVCPPAELLGRIFSCLSPSCLPSFVWDRGFLLQQGATEILVTILHDGNYSLHIAVRGLGVGEGTGRKGQLRVWGGEEKDLERNLIQTFQFLRQAVDYSLLRTHTFATKRMKCPHCRVEGRVHYYDIPKTKEFKCTTFNALMPAADLGLESYFEINCQHQTWQSPNNQTQDFCSLCSRNLHPLFNPEELLFCKNCFMCEMCVNSQEEQIQTLSGQETRRNTTEPLTCYACKDSFNDEVGLNDHQRWCGEVDQAVAPTVEGDVYRMHQAPFILRLPFPPTTHSSFLCSSLGNTHKIVVSHQTAENSHATKVVSRESDGLDVQKPFRIHNYTRSDSVPDMPSVYLQQGKTCIRLTNFFCESNKMIYLNIHFQVAETTMMIKPIRTSLRPEMIRIWRGMRVEAKDLKNPHMVAPATVDGFNDTGELLIYFDGWGRNFDYYAPISFPELHPLGYCTTIDRKLELPKAYHSQKFDWLEYLKEVQSKPIPREFFTREQSEGTPDIFRGGATLPNVLWSVGMRLEALDRKNPHLTCVATVVQVVSDGRVKIYFDGWSNSFDYMTETSNKDLHPIGYCAHVGIALQPPLKYEGEFNWEKYLKETKSQPVPYHLFNQTQKQGCPMHKAYYSPAAGTQPVIMKAGDKGKATENKHPTSFPQFIQANIDLHNTSAFYEIMASQKPLTYFPSVCLPRSQGEDKAVMSTRRKAHNWTENNVSLYHFCMKDAPSSAHESPCYRSHVCPEAKLMDQTFLEQFSNAFAAKDKKKKEKKSKEVTERATTPTSSVHEFMKKTGQFQIATIAMLLKNKRNILGMADFQVIRNSGLHLVEALEVLKRYLIFQYFTLYYLIKIPQLGSEKSESEMQAWSGAMEQMWSSPPCRFHVRSSVPESTDTNVSLCTALTALSGLLLSKNPDLDKFLGEEEYNQVLEDVDPGEVWNLQTISFRDVEKVPPKVEKLNSLKSLSLNDGTIPSFFGVDTMRSSYWQQTLNHLDLTGHPLMVFPESILQLRNLHILSMENCGISQLPDNIGQLQNLRKLNMNFNQFTSLPDSFHQLKNLETLKLRAIALFELIEGTMIGLPITAQHVLSHLEGFYLLHKLKTAPETQTTSSKNPRRRTKPLKNTQEEDVSLLLEESLRRWLKENKYSSSEFRDLESISSTPIDNPRSVYILNQWFITLCPRFKSVPPCVWSLFRLEVLEIGGHDIVQIPPEVKHLKRLITLDLTDSMQLESISGELGALPIKALLLTKCPALRTPPTEVVRRGTENTLAYLKRLLSGFKECTRTKIMLVGLGGAGKTRGYIEDPCFSLVRALLSGRFQSKGTGEGELTDGIDIMEWTIKIRPPGGKPEDKDLSINYSVWDFAGQSVYYNTHQVFRTDLPKEDLQKTFRQIVDFVTISSLTGQGVEGLAHTLHEVALKQKYMGEKVPSIFLQLEKKILAMRKEANLIHYRQVEEMGKDLGLINAVDIRESLVFLHDLGSVQYFPTEFLRDRVVINPQWLVDVMSCLISVKETVIEQGRFELKHIARIWKEFPPEIHPWLLRLTEEFDLTFQLPNINDTYVVPCLLPAQEPLFDWPSLEDRPDMREMKMVYMFEYLPAGLFNRTQTRLCHYSDKHVIWKKGSLLHKNQHMALIRQTKDKEVVVIVQGMRPENVLFLVHEVIVALIAEFFQGVSYDMSIPCSDCVRSGSQDPYMFSARHVRRAEDMKAPFLQCGKNFHIVALQALNQLIPPSNAAEYERHISGLMHDLKEIRGKADYDVLLITCTKDCRESTESVNPKVIEADLIQAGISVIALNETMASSSEELGKKLSGCLVVVACISIHFCLNKHCSSVYSFVKRTSQCPMICVVLAKGTEWKQTNVGMLMEGELFVDMRKKERYPLKFKELTGRIHTKISSTAPGRQGKGGGKANPVFLSYCWANSADAVSKGSRVVPGAVSGVDPRLVADHLEKNGIGVWLDIRFNMEVLFEEIADALRECQLVIACVSDQYLQSNACMLEFRFSSGVLKREMILVPVGKGQEWQQSELAMLSLKSPRVDIRSDEAKEDLDELVKCVKEVVKDCTQVAEEEEEEKANEPDTGKTTGSAYHELCELAQRKFLQQIVVIATKLRAADAEFASAFPRLVFFDILTPLVGVEEKKGAGKKKDEDQIANILSEAFSDDNFYIRILCEHEQGWHDSGVWLPMKELLGTESPARILHDTSSYMAPLLSILQHSAVNVNLLEDPFLSSRTNILNHLKRWAEKSYPLQDAYKRLSSYARNSVGISDSGLARCSLYSRRVLWLCPDHQKNTRGIIAEDEADADDVALAEGHTEGYGGGRGGGGGDIADQLKAMSRPTSSVVPSHKPPSNSPSMMSTKTEEEEVTTSSDTEALIPSRSDSATSDDKRKVTRSRMCLLM